MKKKNIVIFALFDFMASFCIVCRSFIAFPEINKLVVLRCWNSNIKHQTNKTTNFNLIAILYKNVKLESLQVCIR